MFITVTPEVKSLLEIENTLLKTSKQDLPIEIGILSEKEFLCILPKNFVPQQTHLYKLRLKVKDLYHIINVEFTNWFSGVCPLARFEYDLQTLTPQVRQRFLHLFSLNETVKKRKEIRIELDDDTVAKMEIATNTSFLYESKLTDCFLKDVSFSGAHFLALGELPFAFAEQQTALKISFMNPSETFFILSKFVRKNVISEGTQKLSAIGVSFAEPINIKYLNRLNSYFDFSEIFTL